MSDATSALVDRLSRRNRAVLVASLVRFAGAPLLEEVEDAVQDAFVSALRTWPRSGFPTDPAAWLYSVARNRLLDQLRRPGIGRRLSAPSPAGDPPSTPPAETADSELALLFLAAHPSLSPESAVALTLSVAAGFTVDEIARVYLADRRAIQQRLVRAKQRLRTAGSVLEVPPDDRARRLPVVVDVLYAMFTEGYASATSESALRAELCGEAIRLGQQLLADAATARPVVHALLALFCFQASRLAARVGPDGGLILLRDQDRNRWDRGLIAMGHRYLENAASGAELTRFHCEAEIAGCHAAAARYAETDWERIASLYALLESRVPSPIISLNRAIALGESRGPDAAVALLEPLGDRLDQYYPYHAAAGEFARRRGDRAGADRHLRRALALAVSTPARKFLAARVESATENWAPEPAPAD